MLTGFTTKLQFHTWLGILKKKDNCPQCYQKYINVYSIIIEYLVDVYVLTSLNKINPYNTSLIGYEKYAKNRKMTIHQASSFVIARRYQGFIDKQ